MASPTHSTDMSWSRLRKMVKDREAWYAAIHGVAKPPDMTEQLNNSPWGQPSSFSQWGWSLLKASALRQPPNTKGCYPRLGAWPQKRCRERSSFRLLLLYLLPSTITE